MDAYEHNRRAWNDEVKKDNRWTRPVSTEEIAKARGGEWSVLLTPTKAVPRDWFGDLRDIDLLGLASGGGQQCPIFAAAGAKVTSFDASDGQLEQDRRVAERDGLKLRTVQGNMRDLSALEDASFDLVFNPCSTVFVDDVVSVWREVARVLRPGGSLLTGFINPWFYLFDPVALEKGELYVTNKLPVRLVCDGMIEHSHTLDDQLGGQLRAGLMLTDLFEDEWSAYSGIAGVAPAFIATRAIKR